MPQGGLFETAMRYEVGGEEGMGYRKTQSKGPLSSIIGKSFGPQNTSHSYEKAPRLAISALNVPVARFPVERMSTNNPPTPRQVRSCFAPVVSSARIGHVVPSTWRICTIRLEILPGWWQIFVHVAQKSSKEDLPPGTVFLPRPVERPLLHFYRLLFLGK